MILVKFILCRAHLSNIQVCILTVSCFPENVLWQSGKRDHRYLDLHISLPRTLALPLCCAGHSFCRSSLVAILWSMPFMFHVPCTVCHCVRLITGIKTLYFACASTSHLIFKILFLCHFHSVWGQFYISVLIWLFLLLPPFFLISV